jgi:hypothetical protein
MLAVIKITIYISCENHPSSPIPTPGWSDIVIAMGAVYKDKAKMR